MNFLNIHIRVIGIMLMTFSTLKIQFVVIVLFTKNLRAVHAVEMEYTQKENNSVAGILIFQKLEIRKSLGFINFTVIALGDDIDEGCCRPNPVAPETLLIPTNANMLRR